MSVTHITQFQAAPDQESAMAALLSEGQERLRSADGCESFDDRRDQDNPGTFILLQRWTTPAAHDEAFAERILKSGHLEKVLSVAAGPPTHRTFEAAT